MTRSTDTDEAEMWDDARARALLSAMFAAAIAAADPRQVLAPHLPEPPRGRVVVVGCGKAAAVMAAAVEAAWPEVPLSGLVVTRYGHAVPTRRIEVMEAAHPVPDANSERGAARLLDLVAGLTADDLVLALISGGGSALLALPGPGVTLADKRALNQALLASGAAIGEMNTVRSALSAIKGGRLAAAAAPARVVTLAISDVPGDDPAVIASGPTVAARTGGETAAAIVARYRLAVTPAMAALIEQPPPMLHVAPDIRMIATPLMALQAAAAVARAAGVQPLILGDALEGESRGLGQVMAGIAHSVARHALPVAAPVVLLSGGETTVTIGAVPPGSTGAAAPGRGGRNTEFLLALALGLQGAPGAWAIAGDTDGIDGTEDAAGALIAPDTLARAAAAGLSCRALLDGHDSYGLFAALGDLVVTGPTLTNVNDLRAVLVT